LSKPQGILPEPRIWDANEVINYIFDFPTFTNHYESRRKSRNRPFKSNRYNVTQAFRRQCHSPILVSVCLLKYLISSYTSAGVLQSGFLLPLMVVSLVEFPKPTYEVSQNENPIYVIIPLEELMTSTHQCLHRRVVCDLEPFTYFVITLMKQS
jgi:hypothetical protein